MGKVCEDLHGLVFAFFIPSYTHGYEKKSTKLAHISRRHQNEIEALIRKHRVQLEKLRVSKKRRARAHRRNVPSMQQQQQQQQQHVHTAGGQPQPSFAYNTLTQVASNDSLTNTPQPSANNNNTLANAVVPTVVLQNGTTPVDLNVSQVTNPDLRDQENIKELSSYSQVCGFVLVCVCLLFNNFVKSTSVFQ